MKKIGIITIIDYLNYGNRLQNYALQEALKRYPYEIETILNKPTDKSNKILKDRSFKVLFGKIYNKLKNTIINKFIIKKDLKEKYKNLKEFSSKYINETNYVISENSSLERLNKEYEKFIVGSDQVWNPNYRKGSKIDFLIFADKSKRISYAPSFGIGEIPDGYKSMYKTYLSEIPYLSVREDKGREIIEDLAGVRAKVVLDPTLLLNRSDWVSLANNSTVEAREDYVLTYFLGKVPKESARLLNQIKKSDNIKVINLASYKDRKYYSIGPIEFLYLIKNASLFLTNSYHGIVFSLIFKTPFVSFDRKNHGGSMSSRIDTLLETFQMRERRITKIDMNKVFEFEDKEVEEILKNEQKKSFAFLNKALN